MSQLPRLESPDRASGAQPATAPAADPPPADEASLAQRIRSTALSSSSSLWIFLALVLIIVVFSIMKPSAFLGSYNIKSIFINASVALTLSVGMTFVIITAGIDLSVGSVLVFSGVIALKAMVAFAGGTGAAANAGWGTIVLGIARRAWRRGSAGACSTGS